MTVSILYLISKYKAIAQIGEQKTDIRKCTGIAEVKQRAISQKSHGF